jgi:LysR family nitrogen assimilation transcriptional regulator
MDDQILPALDLRQLFYFLALAEHGSISSAAAALGLAQPSLSENISRFEKRLDVQLVIRGIRGVQLTEAGLELARHGAEIVKNAQEAVEQVRQLGTGIRGPVSIAFPPSLGGLLSIPLAETVQFEYPTIRLRIAEALSGHILDWVNSDHLDLGIVYEMPEGDSLSSQAIMDEELFLITAPDHWKGKIDKGRAVEPIGPKDLPSLPLVLPGWPHGTRKLLEGYAKANNINLDVVIEIDSMPQMLGIVERASAYTIAPHAAVVNQVKEGKLALVAIADPNIRRTAYLVRKRSRAVSRASMTVESAIMLIIREMIERFNLEATMRVDG